MSKFNHIESIEETTEAQAFRSIPENTSEPLIENLLHNDSISTFVVDAEKIANKLGIGEPKFVRRYKKHIEELKNEGNSSIDINKALDHGDVINFQEQLKDTRKIDDPELIEQMTDLEETCSMILSLLKWKQGWESIKSKKDKKRQDHKNNLFQGVSDDLDDSMDEEVKIKLYKDYGYAA